MVPRISAPTVQTSQVMHEAFEDQPIGCGARKAIKTTSSEENMKLRAPKNITFWIAVIIAVVGVIASFVTIPFLSPYAFWLVVIAFVLLALGNLLEGL